MLQRPFAFFQSALVAGLLAMMPLALVLLFFGWLYGLLSRVLAPVTGPMNLPVFLADLIVVAVMLGAALILGIALKTKPGIALFAGLERSLLHPVPGYVAAKETLGRLVGGRRRPAFLSVVFVDVTGQGIFVTGFVTEEHADGCRTVFVPTSPNPTSGTVYHVPADKVHPVDVTVESALRCVISCGSGADELMAARRPV
jgi:uncharacterized membrane protein